MKRALTVLSFFTLLSLIAAPAAAQTSYGLRAGASVDPDQFYVGIHAQTAPLADRLHFRPNLEIGFGNSATLVGINLELAYMFRTRQGWVPYVAAGPALNIARTERRSNSGGGFNLALGLEHRGGLFGEMKIGTIDSPELKLAIGFRLR